MEKKRELIATRVTPEEKRLIGAAARLGGESVTAFIRRLIVPEAMDRVQEASRTLSAGRAA